MPKILLAELKQETASFNPVVTRYDDFQILQGDDILQTLGETKTEVSGGLQVLRKSKDIEIAPTLAAWAVSGGPIHQGDLDRLIGQLLDAVRDKADGVEGAYIVLHGAMAGQQEGDPEGLVLTEIRKLLGDVPIVASLDLHAVLTGRMIEAADVLVPYHTYPHVDHFETGQRAARVLLRLLEGTVKPTVARVELPMLVRGDELITATGLFGQAIRDCREIESSPGGLAAGVLIGNPFTDVPALQSNVLITTDNDAPAAQQAAEKIARFMWEHRHQMVAPLTSLDEAIRLAGATDGLTVFSDAADATASGAPGDSNAVLKGLLAAGYQGRALLSIVDATAVDKAMQAGVGNEINVALGGSLDRGRHSPLQVTTSVVSLSDGQFTYENGTTGQGGSTAVLNVGNISIHVTSRPVFVVGQDVYKSQGLDPSQFDIVVVKSPNGFRPYYESIAARIVPVDVPGATSANLRSLPFQHCVRPIFPLDEEVAGPF